MSGPDLAADSEYQRLLGRISSQLFVQKYQLYLPNREELRRELELTLQIAEERFGKEAP